MQVSSLPTAVSAAFTGAMGHAFVASVSICVIAIFFSIVREGKRTPVSAISTTPSGPISSEIAMEQPINEDAAKKR